MCRRLLAPVLALLIVPAPASAQTGTVGQPGGATGSGPRDQLTFRAGPFRVAPYVRVGQVALDTNVFLTAEDRRTDLTANGGPGLRVDAPLGRVDLFVDGNVNYYWFARTTELRRFGGEAGGGFEWLAGAFRLAASSYYVRRFDRPSIEVDERVQRDERRTSVELNLQAGARLRIQPRFDIVRREVAPDQQFLGTDLTQSLTEDRYRAELELRFRVTPKTDLLTLTDQEWSRFPLDATRDVDSNRLAGGFAVASQTRLSGRVLGGVRLFRPRRLARGGNFTQPFAQATLDWKLGEKTHVLAEYRLDTNYSAFSSVGRQLPTVLSQDASLRLLRSIGLRADIILTGALTTLRNNTAVVVQQGGETQAIKRDDRFYWASADLGIRVASRLRLGATASYGSRQSNFSDFGVEGLLVGATLRFNP